MCAYLERGKEKERMWERETDVKMGTKNSVEYKVTMWLGVWKKIVEDESFYVIYRWYGNMNKGDGYLWEDKDCNKWMFLGKRKIPAKTKNLGWILMNMGMSDIFFWSP